MHAEKVMERQAPNWVLLYQDEIAQLWGRATTYNDPESEQYIAASERRISDAKQVGSVSWPAIPTRRHSSSKVVATR
ncbi:MAG: hypothetical protein R3C99_03235 [Pirellulaceae bacterium]